MFSRIFIVYVSIVVLTGSVTFAGAQTKQKKTSVKKPVAAVSPPEKTETKIEEQPATVVTKKNERPTSDGTKLSTSPTAQPLQKGNPEYRYEFTQPDFVNSRIIIEHDDDGIGKISFARRGGDELFTDPITISAAAMKRLNEHFTALNFLDSTESYQYEKDYSHLGNIRISMNRGGKGRLAAFNFTENKNAKALADEYRAISNQAIWIFDITVARENQPLESPNQVKNLESLIRRKEISDPEQMLPFLRELADDERLPLIARNHTLRIIQSIERSAGKLK